MEQKQKHLEELRKISTSELLNIDFETLTEHEQDNFFIVLGERQPFKYYEKWIIENEEMIDEIHKEVMELKKQLRKHRHGDDNKILLEL